MPGVNRPNDEYFMHQLRELQRQFDGLVTNQQMIFTNASDEMIVATGLIPGFNPPLYGIAGFSASGVPVFAMYETVIPDGSGRRQTVVGIGRDDGSVALWCADLGTTPGHPHQQALQWFDRAGNAVIADDTVSGVGVARPHIPTYALMNTNPATWPATNASTPTVIAEAFVEYQQPKLAWTIQVYAPASTTGTFTLQYNGTPLDSQTISGGGGGSSTTWSNVVAVPAGLTFGGLYSITLLGQVTAGAGTIAAQCYWLQGQGS